jgi:hypothetical protein
LAGHTKMAQTGFTPISLYYTATAAATPTAGNLVNGELALNINTADGKLFYKDSAGVVQVLASRDANAGNFTNISVSGVASFADGTVSAPSITNIGDTNTGIFFPAADTIAFTEGGVESMRIDASGNVGIGIDNPVTRLVVRGIAGQAAAYITTPSTGTSVRSNNTFRIQSEAAGRDVYMQFSDTIANSTEIGMVSGNQYFCTNSAERMRITSAGDVGIGASSPVGKLDVTGVSSTNADSRALIFATDTTAFAAGVGGGITFRAKYNTAGLYFDAGNIKGIKENATDGNFAGALVFTTSPNGGSPTERMRIDSSGNVGIGVTNPSAFGKLAVNGNTVQLGGTGTIYINSFADATSSISNSGASGAGNLQFNTNNTERMRIDSSGRLLVGVTSPVQSGSTFYSATSAACVFYRPAGSTGVAITSYFSDVGGAQTFKAYVDTSGAFVNISDARTKKNVEQLNLGIDIVSQLNPVSFNWLNEEESPKTVGFIAQEVESVYPQAVTTFDASDSNGFADQKMMKNDALFPLLVKAIQEQQAMIETLTTRLNALEGK